MHKQLFKYRVLIVFAGLATGAGSVLNLLPVQIEGYNAKFFYLAIILLSSYVFYKFNVNSNQGSKMIPERVLSRDLSNKDFYRDNARRINNY